MRVYLHTERYPEDNAMLQSLYSRSAGGFEKHKKAVMTAESGKFMEKYYVGYGHKSIGDCGTFTLYVEDVDILTSCAIQHHPLYRGQEMSTRYIDFTKQGFVNHGARVGKAKEYAEIVRKMIDVYSKLLNSEIAANKDKYPRSDYPDVSDGVYENAIKAKALDVARNLLPVCMHTSLSVHASISTHRELFSMLAANSYTETARVGLGILNTLKEHYPTSFTGTEEEIELYRKNPFWSDAIWWDDTEILEISKKIASGELPKERPVFNTGVISDTLIEGLNSNGISLEGWSETDKAFISECALNGTSIRMPVLAKPEFIRVVFKNVVSFSAWREIHRHNAFQRICNKPSFLYAADTAVLADVDPEIRDEYISILQEASRVLDGYEEILDSLAPLGTPVGFAMDAGYSALNYFMKLRSGMSVHPEVREIVHILADVLERLAYQLSERNGPNDKLLHDALQVLINGVNREPSEGLFIERGKETIEER